jgi:hypothetical protein
MAESASRGRVSNSISYIIKTTPIWGLNGKSVQAKSEYQNPKFETNSKF